MSPSTTQQLFIDTLTAQGFEMVASEEEFLEYYLVPLRGHYRSQPWDTPEGYPVMIREEAIINNPNGFDYAVLSYVYL